MREERKLRLRSQWTMQQLSHLIAKREATYRTRWLQALNPQHPLEQNLLSDRTMVATPLWSAYSSAGPTHRTGSDMLFQILASEHQVPRKCESLSLSLLSSGWRNHNACRYCIYQNGVATVCADYWYDRDYWASHNETRWVELSNLESGVLHTPTAVPTHWALAYRAPLSVENAITLET